MTTLDPARLRAYLTRVGIDAPARAERDALDALIAAQLAAIPFENIDPLLRRPVAIDADSVFDKLVTRARGGYCFELNTLLAAALEALGFRVTPLAARVRWQVPPDRLTLQTHMLLRVEAAHRSYIVDVGFGGPTPDRALPLDGERDDTRPYRLAAVPASAATGAYPAFDLEARGDGGWRQVYRFDLAPQHWLDFVPRNWYVATHPDSIFLRRLMVARTEGSTRLTLGDGEFAARAADGSVQRERLADAQAVLDVLDTRFGIVLDAASRAGLAQALPALLAGGRPA
ncbi:arylamine N-acetyltransferase [Cupriavidus sp. USMAHM13]|uniref:Arylamine N-acetyltransferase n=1 Tax=Cupriavidus malaysiensis TaxID=367825 RepID=A0A1D9IAW5_9BURK|nr:MULTISPECIES: arylamine N-acetyltransferase [Cupriavidus]AOZ03396.1 arylamine N-acetyltransferase [Cupriavidus sp. USMAHM13]AOZ09242.1 arylamine N-acetyltransferase [Cupriavidus malaysiensis]